LRNKKGAQKVGRLPPPERGTSRPAATRKQQPTRVFSQGYARVERAAGRDVPRSGLF